MSTFAGRKLKLIIILFDVLRIFIIIRVATKFNECLLFLSGTKIGCLCAIQHWYTFRL